VLIICSVIGLAGSIWLIYANTYSSTLGARILQGIGVSFVSAALQENDLLTDYAKYEGVGFGLIADLYFVHEQGARIGAFLFPLGAFNVMCPLLSGVVSQNLGIP
jgi:putative Mn2+ efflux pump MntP